MFVHISNLSYEYRRVYNEIAVESKVVKVSHIILWLLPNEDYHRECKPYSRHFTDTNLHLVDRLKHVSASDKSEYFDRPLQQIHVLKYEGFHQEPFVLTWFNFDPGMDK